MNQVTLLISVVVLLILAGIWLHWQYTQKPVLERAVDETGDVFGRLYDSVASWF